MLTRQTAPWLKKRLMTTNRPYETDGALLAAGVNTVCKAGLCPNLNECFAKKHVTFLILGNACTRSCGFCSVEKSDPLRVDDEEPYRVLETVKTLGLSYVVITSVTRDDLEDGGAEQFAKTARLIKGFSKEIGIEVLVPDFKGNRDSIEKALAGCPDVFAHNIETVRRLYGVVRNAADYARSLGVLKIAKELQPGQITKSGIMLGLGETEAEIIDTLSDLRAAGCDILTMGQYLRPGPDNIPVKRFVEPSEFERYRTIAEGLGFKAVASGPFVRSSYLAEETYKKLRRPYDRS